jgi:nucleotide-binding universal stress UspA family protein
LSSIDPTYGITSREETEMLKVLLPVDGSESAVRATHKFIETLDWYKEQPRVDLLAVHLPVPRFPNMRVVVSDEMLERYYADECAVMLAPSRKALDAAGVRYTTHTLVGAIGEGIIDQAKQSGSNMIYMGTRGMTALSNMVLGSVTTRVLHLAHIPVVLIH